MEEPLNIRLSDPIPAEIGNLVVKFSIDGRLTSMSILIRADLIRSVIDAVHEKWGKPHAKGDKIYQNRFGAKVEGWVEKWTMGETVVLLMKIPRKIDEIIYVYTLQTQKQFDKDNPPQGKPIL